MKRSTRQASSTLRANRMKATLNLAASAAFNKGYGPFGLSGQPAGYYTYTHLGYEVRLRFNQENHEWAATCPYFGIETTFAHQPAPQIQALLNEWVLAHIEQTASFPARLRQIAPAVQSFASRHGITVTLADEMLQERAF